MKIFGSVNEGYIEFEEIYNFYEIKYDSNSKYSVVIDLKSTQKHESYFSPEDVLINAIIAVNTGSIDECIFQFTSDSEFSRDICESLSINSNSINIEFKSKYVFGKTATFEFDSIALIYDVIDIEKNSILKTGSIYFIFDGTWKLHNYSGKFSIDSFFFPNQANRIHLSG